MGRLARLEAKLIREGAYVRAATVYHARIHIMALTVELAHANARAAELDWFNLGLAEEVQSLKEGKNEEAQA